MVLAVGLAGLGVAQAAPSQAAEGKHRTAVSQAAPAASSAACSMNTWFSYYDDGTYRPHVAVSCVRQMKMLQLSVTYGTQYCGTQTYSDVDTYVWQKNWSGPRTPVNPACGNMTIRASSWSLG